MNIGHANKKIEIPAHIHTDIQTCHNQFPRIRGINSADEGKKPLTCGHQMDTETIAVCAYHQGILADLKECESENPHQAFVEIKDYEHNPKDIDEGLGNKIVNFVKKHPLLTAGAAVITGLIFYKAITSRQQATENVGTSEALVGAEAIEHSKNHALEIHSQVSDSIKLCTGSALEDDIIITTANCVSHSDQKIHNCQYPNGTAATEEDYYSGFDYDTDQFEGSGAYEDASDLETKNNSISCTVLDTFIKLPAENVTVLFNGTEYLAENIIAHADYNMSAAGVHNDIALVKLTQRMPNVPTVALPTNQSNTELRAEITANGNGTNPSHPNNLFTQGWLKQVNGTHRRGDWEIKQTAVHRLESTEEFNDAIAMHHINCEQLLCAESNTTDIRGSDIGAPVFYHSNNGAHLVGIAAKSLNFNVTAPLNKTHVVIQNAHENFATVNIDVHQQKTWIESAKLALNANASTTAPTTSTVGIVASSLVGLGVATGAVLAAKKLCFSGSGEHRYTEVAPSLGALIMQEEAV